MTDETKFAKRVVRCVGEKRYRTVVHMYDQAIGIFMRKSSRLPKFHYRVKSRNEVHDISSCSSVTTVLKLENAELVQDVDFHPLFHVATLFCSYDFDFEPTKLGQIFRFFLCV